MNYFIDVEVSLGFYVIFEWENKFYRDLILSVKGKIIK